MWQFFTIVLTSYDIKCKIWTINYDTTTTLNETAFWMQKRLHPFRSFPIIHFHTSWLKIIKNIISSRPIDKRNSEEFSCRIAYSSATFVCYLFALLWLLLFTIHKFYDHVHHNPNVFWENIQRFVILCYELNEMDEIDEMTFNLYKYFNTFHALGVWLY